MAQKIKLTRPELKRQRDALQRYSRYLPMLKLKQQQLQMMVRNVVAEMREAQKLTQAAREKFEPYRAVLVDRAGVDVKSLCTPQTVRTHEENVAGVVVPIYEGVEFSTALYSLFATPAWVDGVIRDLRELRRREAHYDVLQREHRLLERELTKIIQRVNLFEKVKIPDCREAIRRIRIHLGDEMTAGVGRAKIAKGKLTRSEQTVYGGSEVLAPPIRKEVPAE
ncbi:MAG: V-type ATP synthase subunit D [Phycisphaerae bacterium]|nr:V-type ATP synthase subunit D [Phycisphaerae bacterium]